jgi:hypothetical protein
MSSLPRHQTRWRHVLEEISLGRNWYRIVRGVVLIASALAGAFFIYQSIITGHSGVASVWAR